MTELHKDDVRKPLDWKTLKEQAEKYSEEIMVREYNNGASVDTRRKSTEQEKEIIFNVLYGALHGLNWGDECRRNRKMEQAICDTAEFIIDNFINKEKFGIECNGYDTIYIPLKKILADWNNL